MGGTATTLPVFHSDISALIHDLVIAATQDMITVKWDHDYYLCRNFTVILDDTVVPGCSNITALNCTIRNLDIGKVYEVITVVSTESCTNSIESSGTIAMLDPNAGM